MTGSIEDLRKQKAKPPFPPQRQEPPGVEKDMRPRPDYGEGGILRRAAQPAEMAPIYVLLASTESSYVTGMVHGATGGQLLP